MTLFLRDKDNRSIVDIDIYVEKNAMNPSGYVEIHSSVIIDRYSKFLLENLEYRDEIIETFTYISDLRGWLWESYFLGDDNDPLKLNDVIKEVSDVLKEVANTYKLSFVVD